MRSIVYIIVTSKPTDIPVSTRFAAVISIGIYGRCNRIGIDRKPFHCSEVIRPKNNPDNFSTTTIRLYRHGAFVDLISTPYNLDITDPASDSPWGRISPARWGCDPGQVHIIWHFDDPLKPKSAIDRGSQPESKGLLYVASCLHADLKPGSRSIPLDIWEIQICGASSIFRIIVKDILCRKTVRNVCPRA